MEKPPASTGAMSFRIPKKPRLEEPEQSTPSVSECSEITRATKEQFEEVVNIVSRNRTIERETVSEKSWKTMEVTNVMMIKSPTLETKFLEYKKRTQIKEEFWAYRVVHDNEETSIAKGGLRTRQDEIPDIGDPARGVFVYSSPPAAYPTRLIYDNMDVKMVLFRSLRGRAQEVNLESGRVQPSRKHNCHVAYKSEFENNDIDPLALEHRMGAVYHYEFLPESGKLSKVPSSLLPYAVITFKKRELLSSEEKLGSESKINYKLNEFTVEENGNHIIKINNKTHNTSILVPNTMLQVPHVINYNQSTPVVYSLPDMKQFTMLKKFRTTHFGKLLTSESVIFDAPNQEGSSAVYLLLKTTMANPLRDEGMFLQWCHHKFTVFYLPSGHASAEFGFPYMKDCLHVIVFGKNIGNGTANQLIGSTYSGDFHWLCPDIGSLMHLHPSILQQPKKGIIGNVDPKKENKKRRLTFKENIKEVRYYERDETEVPVVKTEMTFEDRRKQEELMKKEVEEKAGTDAVFREAMQGKGRATKEPETPPVNLMNVMPPSNVRVNPGNLEPTRHRNSEENVSSARPISEGTRHSVPPLPLPSVPNSPVVSASPNFANPPPMMTGVPPPIMSFNITPPVQFGAPPILPNLLDRLQPRFPINLPSSSTPPVDTSRPPPPVGFVIPPPSLMPNISLSAPSLTTQNSNSSNHGVEIGEAPMDVSMDDKDDEEVPMEVEEQVLRAVKQETMDSPIENDEDYDQQVESPESPHAHVKIEPGEENEILTMAFSQTSKPAVVAEVPTTSSSSASSIAGTMSQLTPDTLEMLRRVRVQNEQKELEEAALKAKQVPTGDTDLRVPAPSAITFSINTPKTPLVASIANLLGGDDDDDEDEVGGQQTPAHSSHDVDYRSSSAPVPKTQFFHGVPQDRDDRRRDIDERPEIPLPSGLSGKDRQKLTDKFQEKLRVQSKEHDKRAVLNNTIENPLPQPCSSNQPAGYSTSHLSSLFSNLSNYVLGPEGLVPAPLPVVRTEEVTPRAAEEPEPEPERRRSPSPVEIAEPDEEAYVPKTFMTQTKSMPTVAKEGYNTYRTDGKPRDASVETEKSPKKPSKPFDYDYRRSTSDRQVKKGWDNALVSMLRKKSANEREDGEIDSGDEKNRSQCSEASTSGSSVVLLDDLNVPPSFNPRPGNGFRGSPKKKKNLNERQNPNANRHMQQQARQPFSFPSRGRGGYNQRRSFDANHFGNGASSTNNGASTSTSDSYITLLPDIDAEATNYSVFIDPNLTGLKQSDLNELFTKFVKLRQVQPPSPRHHFTVYMHQQVYKEMTESTSTWGKYFTTFSNYKNGNQKVVEVLPRHSCDTTCLPKFSDMAECMQKVNTKQNGVEAIFLTHNHKPDSDFGRVMSLYHIHLMDIREFNRKLAEIDY